MTKYGQAQAYWHEMWRWWIGNYIVASHHLLLFFHFPSVFSRVFSSVVYVYHRSSPQIKNLFSKRESESSKTFTRLRRQIGPPCVPFGFAGSAALQAASECPLRRYSNSIYNLQPEGEKNGKQQCLKSEKEILCHK